MDAHATDPRPASPPDLLRWLLDEGRLLPTPGALLAALCGRLEDAGLGINRVSVTVWALHAEISHFVYVWHRKGAANVVPPPRHVVVESRSETIGGASVLESAVRYGSFQMPAFANSPLVAVVDEGREVRYRLLPDATDFPFGVYRELRDGGATDYVAMPMRLNQGPTSMASFVTAKPGGYTDADLTLLRSLLPAITLVFELHSSRIVTRSLLRAYLGAEPGTRVQAGQVRVGDVRSIDAAIVFSDLRGFTALSAGLDSKALVDTLNGYFGAITRPIEAHGGDILKFIGDALLVVFTVTPERPAEAACAAALGAVTEANLALDRWNEERAARGEPPLDHGLGLHLGTAEYGNIGSSSRVDFTVIGPDVNLASRIEGTCARLGRRVVASSAFASRAAAVRWESLGTHALKGVPEPQALFGLPQAG